MKAGGSGKKKAGGPGAAAADPVRCFEKWKKKHTKTRALLKQQQKKKKKPQWQQEKEDIQRLLSRYEDIRTEEVLKFSDLPLSRKTLLGLQEARYRQPTEIQRQTIGLALRGRDVLAAAKTGSGKTLAFLVPVLESLYRQQWTPLDGLGALIISPTRELAYQTFEVLRRVGRNHEFSAGLVIGGKDLKSESARICRTNIVICTPGRLLQHMDQTASFQASSLQVLVLDEADRILDMGFAETLNAIVENLPATRQTLLFSATQTKSVKDLARLSLRDPEYVWVHEKARFSTPATLEQSYMVCELHHKVDMLYSFIRSHLRKKIIVFFACCKEVQYLYRAFCRLRPGTPVLALHGKQQQMKRVEVYDSFVKKSSAVLFATDLAARGLDFPAVNWVVQFDCPEDANTYIHRVGRTARYQQGGEALLLLLPSEEAAVLAQLEEKKVPISRIQVNPDKLQSVQQKLEAFLAQEAELKERAQRCFVSYLRSVYLMTNKEVFDVFKLKLQDYALSLGLAVAPRVRFLSKAREQRAQERLQNLQARPDGEEDESPGDRSEDDEDLRDLDLLTVKRRDVFSETGAPEEAGPPTQGPKQPADKESRYREAKKLLKRNFQINTKVTFNEEGEAVQLWPPAPQAAGQEEEEEQEGINVEKAKERLRREDQQFDKLEYRRKVQAKHRERRMKAKEARREASRRRRSDQEQEAGAQLASHSEDEFDFSALPDPDPSSEEEEEEAQRKRRKTEQQDEEQPGLDTGLTLAEDEELVLHLLAGRH
ncbi:probable ATP-dependent RNA helicase DDX10 isoform X1 [Cyprinodon tularosa]|uniref:probable ATP-dependent RNA helicase DDX10 isoform X1 n=1 Tax=Cyprinodon tularosa TaxID=77115 RepID=UPI0018E28B29|nr:probable ATP-dependent RNA helicase DDX10 isoform X1 [Cyprinodon tularosa]